MHAGYKHADKRHPELEEGGGGEERRGRVDWGWRWALSASLLLAGWVHLDARVLPDQTGLPASQTISLLLNSPTHPHTLLPTGLPPLLLTHSLTHPCCGHAPAAAAAPAPTASPPSPRMAGRSWPARGCGARPGHCPGQKEEGGIM